MSISFRILACLCDPAPNPFVLYAIQRDGPDPEQDITGSLRGFQLKSQCAISIDPTTPNSKIIFRFLVWVASATDRYDWNYAEHFTPFNPDYGSKAAYAVCPGDKKSTVYHTNAERLEKADKAAPFKVIIKPWRVEDDTGITKQSEPLDISDLQKPLTMLRMDSVKNVLA